MKITKTTFKSKSWGVVPHPDKPGHYYTGWDKSWAGRSRHASTPKETMLIGENVVIEGDFKITGMSRGFSAANYRGSFRDHEDVFYDLSLSGGLGVLNAIQNGAVSVVDGWLRGRWTFTKQGSTIFLEPCAGAEGA